MVLSFSKYKKNIKEYIKKSTIKQTEEHEFDAKLTYL
jgi:hypothetical protein